MKLTNHRINILVLSFIAPLLAAGVPAGETVSFSADEGHAGEVHLAVDDIPFLMEVIVIPSRLESGIILSAGDANEGFALWFDEGRPAFTVIRMGRRTELRGNPVVPGKAYRFSGRLDHEGSTTLMDSDREIAAEQGGGWLRAGGKLQVHIKADPGGVTGRPDLVDKGFPGGLRRGLLHTGLQTFMPTRDVPGNLQSIFFDEGAVDEPWLEFPRPHFVRQFPGLEGPAWQNLNGWWDYAIVPVDSRQPMKWDGEIRVPFAIESQLSGVGRWVGPEHALWYHREITLEHPPRGDQRILLNFEAVDWETTVWVNGLKVGDHRGGHSPFTFDITDAVRSFGPQQIVVRVWDPTDSDHQPRGKQALSPIGFWYVAVTGIWQTVWLETVPNARLTGLSAPEVKPGENVLSLTPRVQGLRTGDHVRVTMRDGDKVVSQTENIPHAAIHLRNDAPRFWSPDDPFLYDLDIEILRNGKVIDHVRSYTGWRSMEWKEDENGHVRYFLNGEPVFLNALLDQGWWPDGLLSAPSDAALRYDIEKTVEMGFNMIRKAVTIEPARWYYHADKLGVMIWQDMPTGFAGPLRGPYHVHYLDDEDWERPRESARQFEREYAAMVDSLAPFPSILMWTVFNEGWGQYETARLDTFARMLDPTRSIHTVSGWADRGLGSAYDFHVYPGPGMVDADQVPGRALVLGEFGGLGHVVPAHRWQDDYNWGYSDFEDPRELLEHYSNLIETLNSLKSRGLAGAVYTQTTDVEGEVNGLLTYDRAVMKLDPAILRHLHQRLYTETPQVVCLLPISDPKPQRWEYQSGRAIGRDGSGWQVGEGPFGNAAMRGHDPRTDWPDPRLRMRRTFQTDEPIDTLLLRYKINASAAVVRINGKEVARPEYLHRVGRQYFETTVHIEETLPPGEHVLELDLNQPGRFRFADLGIMAVYPEKGAVGIDWLTQYKKETEQ